ncbi:acyltransferase [Altererythrobacter sp. B11]|uniref:acyltransferase family protein n=1 Tax=Altererythrobacter sp. B11 TaxID=2060312 RepID=UPI000DC70078|nr:acyltransferase family protein [Altererythrobacter sp. B11]BBC73135.1 acyltransferase [Altererythrobacter sp. B11]
MLRSMAGWIVGNRGTSAGSGISKRFYRADIDGLRAIAVLAVVLFHLDPAKLTGGFAGVDIFFVISGFLIGGQIDAELAAERFSMASFYAKRIRRLYPALVVTVLITLAVSVPLLFPTEVRRVARAAVATMTYTSNFYFYQAADYFAEGDIRPLLHTWSLAVEEQFYLVLPVLLLALHRYAPRWKVVAIAAMALASLAYAEWLVERDSDAAFFFGVTRFWEFGAGALLALTRPRPLAPHVADGAVLAGLVVIAGSFLLFTETAPVPGLVALPLVLGSALVIHAGASSPVIAGCGLSLTPLVFVGRISYSLYLAHWPIVVLVRANLGPERAPLGLAAMLAASLVAAWLLYRFVECPARRLSIARYRQQIFTFGAGSTALVAVLAVVLLSSGVHADKKEQSASRLIAYLDYDAQTRFRAGSCLINAEADKEDDDFDAFRCVPPPMPGHEQVLLIGDSYAAQYYQALHANFPKLQIAQVTATGCRPLLAAEGADRCVDLIGMGLKQLVRQRQFAAVILAGRWREEEVGDLVRTVRYLKRRTERVYVVGRPVEYAMPLPRLLALAETRGEKHLVADVRELERLKRIDRAMEAAVGAAGDNVRYVSVLQAMCDARNCVTQTRSGVPTQFDYGHLTYEGALLVVDRLREAGRFKLLAQANAASAR